jgi:hypothetical protein
LESAANVDEWLVSASWTCLQVQRVLIHALAGTHALASVSAVVGPTVPGTACCIMISQHAVLAVA